MMDHYALLAFSLELGSKTELPVMPRCPSARGQTAGKSGEDKTGAPGRTAADWGNRELKLNYRLGSLKETRLMVFKSVFPHVVFSLRFVWKP